MANLEPMLQELEALRRLEQRAQPQSIWTTCHCHNCHWARMTGKPAPIHDKPIKGTGSA